MGSYDYDLFVIGGGSGGVRAARVSAGLGKRVAIAEEYRFGGTCVIRGCVPKKLYVYASQFPEHFADAAGYGWTVPEARFDWHTLVANKDREIARLEGIYRKGVEGAGGEVFQSRATLVDGNAADYADYAGRYQFWEGYAENIHHRDGALWVEFVDDDAEAPVRLLPLSDATFYLEGDPSRMTFLRDRNGAVLGYQLVAPDGGLQFARRLP